MQLYQLPSDFRIKSSYDIKKFSNAIAHPYSMGAVPRHNSIKFPKKPSSRCLSKHHPLTRTSGPIATSNKAIRGDHRLIPRAIIETPGDASGQQLPRAALPPIYIYKIGSSHNPLNAVTRLGQQPSSSSGHVAFSA